jgi:hypothetical protein
MARNPKKVVEAFNAHGAKVGGITLREFTPSTITIMQQINSPLMKASNGKIEMTDMDILRMLFVLAHPAGHSFGFLMSGTKAFDQAVIEFGDALDMKEMPELGKQLLALFSKAMSTAPSDSSADGASTSKKNGGSGPTHLAKSQQAGAASAGS